MNAKQMLQAAGFPDTKKGRADFYKQYPTKEAFMMKFGGQATASNFFTFGQEPNYPVAFYAEGGPTGTEDPWLQSRNPMIPANAKQVNAKDLGLRVNPNTKMIYLDQKGYPADSVVANPVDPKLALYYTHGKGVMGPSAPQHMNYANQWNNQNAQYFLDKNQNFYPTYGGDPKFITKKHGGQPCFECGGQHMQNGGQNTSDIDNAVNAHKQSFMDYIQKNVQAAQQKKMMEQMMMGTHMEMPFELPKHQYGPPGEDGVPLIRGTFNPLTQSLGLAGKSDISYTDPNPYDPRQHADQFTIMNSLAPVSGYGPGYVDPNQKPAPFKEIDLNNIQMQGNAPMSMDPLNQSNALGLLDFSKPDVSSSAFPHITYQGSDQPPYEMGKTQYMVEPGTGGGNQMGMDWRNPQQDPAYTGNAAYNYNPIMMDENQLKNRPITSGMSDEELQKKGQTGELQAGRGRKLNPYNILLGTRLATHILSGDERAHAEDQQQKFGDVNYWSMTRQPEDRGNYVVNTPNGAHFRPNATGAKVDPWGQANRKGQIGNPYYTAQYGGEQEGGEVEMTDAEIMQFLAMGGQLEILE